jgi:lipoprotein-anchoring transpeptidase ErfK/SrfK
MKKILFLSLFFIVLSISVVLTSISGYIYSTPTDSTEPATVGAPTITIPVTPPTTAPKELIKCDSLVVENNQAIIIELSQEENAEVRRWTSSDSNVIAVDDGGRIDALSVGNATVTAEFSDKIFEYQVSVIEKAEAKPEYDGYSTCILANTDILEKNLSNSTNKNPYYIKVNRTQNCVTVYTYDDNGDYTVPVRAMICSSGKNNATIKGDFSLYFKNEWNGLFQGVYGHYVSGIWGDFLFHSVSYYTKSPDRLEVEEFNKLGEQASLGCIRMETADVKWIFDNCPVNTGITIYDDDNPGPLGKPEGIKITDFSCGWDPTDSDPNNPYNDKKPEILGANDREIKIGESFDPLAGISATDTCGNDITEKIKIIENVVTSKEGSYAVTYFVEDVMHRTDSVTVTVSVIK